MMVTEAKKSLIKSVGVCLILGKQPTFRDTVPVFPVKWILTNDYRNSILMTCHYPDLGQYVVLLIG